MADRNKGRSSPRHSSSHRPTATPSGGSSNIRRSSGSSIIDVSHWQGAIDWAKLRASGVNIAFIKATQGTGKLDVAFQRNWQQARQRGIQRGAYHFFTGDDPTRQANFFVKSLGSDRGEMRTVLDLETNPGFSKQDFTNRVKTWLDRVETLTGKKPMVYTSASFWNANTTRPNWAGQYPLWVAQYGAKSPKLPAGWTKADYWQFSDKGRIAGIQGNVDLNTSGASGIISSLATSSSVSSGKSGGSSVSQNPNVTENFSRLFPNGFVGGADYLSSPSNPLSAMTLMDSAPSNAPASNKQQTTGKQTTEDKQAKSNNPLGSVISGAVSSGVLGGVGASLLGGSKEKGGNSGSKKTAAGTGSSGLSQIAGRVFFVGAGVLLVMFGLIALFIAVARSDTGSKVIDSGFQTVKKAAVAAAVL